MLARRKRYELLIADDDQGFRETLRDVLAPYYQTVEVCCGEEAVEVVRHRLVDVALLDMHMHAMTGLEAVQILKRLRSLLPCILISADADADLEQAAARVSAFRVLKKPVARQELLETISTALLGNTQG